MTEEEYLSSKGYGRSGFGDVALAKGNYRNRTGKAILQRQNTKDVEYANKRTSLRAEYNRKLSSGEIRQPSRIEQLIKTTRGNSDNEAVKAARRVLEKRGVLMDLTILVVGLILGVGIPLRNKAIKKRRENMKEKGNEEK